MKRDHIWIGLLLFCGMLVFAIRMSAPADLEGYAQARNIGYIIDLVERGNWLAQRDIEGRIISKPPLHTWTIAPFALALGVNRLPLVLPSFLAVMALTLLVFHIGKRQFGLLAGGFAGLAVVLAPMMSKHLGLVRSDALFTLWIAAGAWSAYRAWAHGKSWTWFWLFAALSTLTKGPLGLVISASGLLAWFWEKRRFPGTRTPSGSHLPGLLLFALLCGGWFAAAVSVHGRELVDKLIFDELLGQATGARKDSFPGANFPEPTLNLLSRFVPFSFLGFYGLWRVVRRPPEDPDERRFGRFLAMWVFPGLLILSLAAHHRGDLVLPLWPPLALLAGAEGARLARRFPAPRVVAAASAVGVLLLAYAAITYHGGASARNKVIRYSEEIRKAAEAFRESGIPPDEVAYLDTPTTFQMYLGSSRIWTTREKIRASVSAGNPPRYLGTESDAVDAEAFGAKEAVEVFRRPEDSEPAVVRIFEMRW